MSSKESRDATAHVRGNGGTLVLKSIRTLRCRPLAGVLPVLLALLAIALSTAACEDDAASVREANQTPAAPTATATPTISAEIQVTELEDGDCVNSSIPEGISIDTVVIVPCSGDWQYRVLKSFQVADAEAYPDEDFFISQVSENCGRQTFSYLYPLAQGWGLGDRTVTCLQQTPALVISDLLHGSEINTEDLTDDEVSCLEEWVAGANLIAFIATPVDPAVIDDFVAQLERCVPDQLGAAPAEPVTGASLPAAEVYARVAPSIVFIETPAGKGSGVLIDEGYIVTNRHVVWPYESVWVTFPDGAWYEDVPVIGWDALSDLAVIGPVDTSVAPAELADGEDLAPGSELYLIGYPAETEAYPEPTMSRGVLSRFREWEWFGMTYLQTDASIAGGQSGGALVNDRGQVVGISTFSFSEAEYALATSISDDFLIIDELILWGWDSAEPSRRRLPTGEGDFGYTVTIPNQWTAFSFVLDGEAGMALQIGLDGPGDGGFIVVGPGGLIGSVDDRVTGAEYVELELTVDGLHFVIVGMSSAGPQVFQLSSNVPLRHLPDPDDEETIQVWETVTGNVDHPFDPDSFWLRLEEGESVAVFAESMSIDTRVAIGFPGLRDTMAQDDDSGGGIFGTDSVVFYRALQSGRHFILVSDATNASVGGYLLGVEAIDALEIWDRNGDGTITCDEAKADDIAPVSFTHPAYDFMDDGDSDGVVCE